MTQYTKLQNYMLILNNKNEYLHTYTRELHRAHRYDYPISSLNVFLPSKMTKKKIQKFILESFRESDIIYHNDTNNYLQVILPFTPYEHLDILINRMMQHYSKEQTHTQLRCEKVDLRKDTDDLIQSAIRTIEQADKHVDNSSNMNIRFQGIFSKLLKIIEGKTDVLSCMNYYRGIKVNYKMTFMHKSASIYTFKTDPMQLAAIHQSSATTIEIKKYGYAIHAELQSIDYIENTVSLKNLHILPYNNIYPSSLTVELKEPLQAKLVSLRSTANISVSAVSFDEVHGYGDISQLVIGNNTLRLVLQKDKKKHTLLVQFSYSKFNGSTQKFILKIIDDSQKSLELFQDLVTQRSRECIQELKNLTA